MSVLWCDHSSMVERVIVVHMIRVRFSVVAPEGITQVY